MTIPESYNYFTNPDEIGSRLDSMALGYMSDEEVDDILTELNLPLPDRSALAKRALSRNSIDRWEVVQDRFLPAWALSRLAKDEHHEIRAFVAMHPNVTNDTADILAVDEDNVVRFNVALGGGFSHDVAQLLAHDEDPQVRAVMVSQYVIRDREALDEMADDKSELVRGHVAMLTQDPDIMRRYFDHDTEAVWSRIACNTHAPKSLLEAILDRYSTAEFEDANTGMFYLAKHEKATKKMLKKIGSSVHEVASSVAKARLK